MEQYLKDKDFLKEICSQKNLNVYARIIALTEDENPLEAIEGKITNGSINIDGTSAVRRTCSLSLTTSLYTNDTINYIKLDNQYWGENTKINIEIGIDNNKQKYSTYPIIWFPMGIYIISSFSSSFTTTGINISISGKDKMCQLNGELGGTITAQTDFGVVETKDFSGTVVKTKKTIASIIKDMVHIYANEPFSKIIIEDISNYGLKLQSYRGNIPFYFFRDAQDPQNILQLTEHGSMQVMYNDTKICLSEISELDFYHLNMDNQPQGKIFVLNNREIYIDKITYGDIAGYKLSELVYPSELIAQPGETIVTMLDKIKKMLGDYEYFYDLNGTFVFRKQRAYKNTTSNLNQNINLNNSYLIQDLDDYIDFTFDNLDLVTGLNNNTDIGKIKNDYTVWGTRQSILGNNIPIHMRYAIDQRPTKYTTIDLSILDYVQNDIFYSRAFYILNAYPSLFPLEPGETIEEAEQRLLKQHNGTEYNSNTTDWRELIYQMALDHRNFNQVEEFNNWLEENNDWIINGKTGYEQYYIDILGFWRDLYMPDDVYLTYNTNLEEGIKYNIDFTGNVTKKYEYKITDPFDLKNDIDENDEPVDINPILYIKKNKSYQSIGSLQTIIKNNYNILGRQITRLAYNDLLGTNPELALKIIKANPNLTTELDLIFKDPRSVVRPNKDSDWGYPLNKKQFYHRFQEQYYRASEKDNSVYCTYMSISRSRKLHGEATGVSVIMNDINKYFTADDEFEYVQERYVQDENFPLNINNCSSMFKNVENNYFEWFIEHGGKNSGSFQSLGIYYPLDSMTVYTKKTIDNKDSYEVFDLSSKFNSKKICFNKMLNWAGVFDTNAQGWTNNSKSISAFRMGNMQDTGYNNNSKLDTNQLLIFCKFLTYWFPTLISYKNSTFNEEGWNRNIFDNPELLNFWFDIYEPIGELEKYSVKNIGLRQKITNDTNIQAIKYQPNNQIIFIDPNDELTNTPEKRKQYFESAEQLDYLYINLGSGIGNLFATSSIKKDAFNVIENQLYEYSQCSQNISISCIPQYFLQPNTKIEIYDANSNIGGKYTLQKISISLGHNSVMQLTASRTIESSVIKEVEYLND